jgi:hypothetical protein
MPPSPFSDDDAAALRAISPLFATALASCVRGNDDEEAEGDADTEGEEKDTPFADGGAIDNDSEPPQKPKKQKKDDADWWKRGEPPPF